MAIKAYVDMLHSSDGEAASILEAEAHAVL